MFKGFKEFLSRGNVIDLAVAVVIGAAFTGLVTSFTEKVVQPLVDRVGAGGDREYGILKISLGGDPEQFLDFNAVLSAFINFLIVAAVVYFVIVVPYKKLKERDSEVEQEETELTCSPRSATCWPRSRRARQARRCTGALDAAEARSPTRERPAHDKQPPAFGRGLFV